MELKEFIFELFKHNYCGKTRAVTRFFLLHRLWAYYEHITDREMRQAYEDLPICGSSNGLYLPETQAEIDEQIEIHRKKIRAYAMKIKILKRYKISTDSVQRELF